MKTRSGFVSNSSSSSYVLVLKEEDYKALVEGADPLTQAIANHFGGDEVSLGDIPLRAVQWMSGNYDTLEDFDIHSHTDAIKAYLKEHENEEVTADDLDDEDFDDYEFYDVLHECWSNFVKQAEQVGFVLENYS